VPTTTFVARPPLQSSSVADANTVLAGQNTADDQLLCVNALLWGLPGEHRKWKGRPILCPHERQSSIRQGGLDLRESLDRVHPRQGRQLGHGVRGELGIHRPEIGELRGGEDQTVGCLCSSDVGDAAVDGDEEAREQDGDRYRHGDGAGDCGGPRSIGAQAAKSHRKRCTMGPVGSRLDRRDRLGAQICCGREQPDDGNYDRDIGDGSLPGLQTPGFGGQRRGDDSAETHDEQRERLRPDASWPGALLGGSSREFGRYRGFRCRQAWEDGSEHRQQHPGNHPNNDDTWFDHDWNVDSKELLGQLTGSGHHRPCDDYAEHDADDGSEYSEHCSLEQKAADGSQWRCTEGGCDRDFASTFFDGHAGDLSDQDDAHPDRDEREDPQQGQEHGVDVEPTSGILAGQYTEAGAQSVGQARSDLRRAGVVGHLHVDDVDIVGPGELRLGDAQRQHDYASAVDGIQI